MVADQVAHLAHLNARDTTLGFVSARLAKRVDSVQGADAMDDALVYPNRRIRRKRFGVDEWHGTNAFIRVVRRNLPDLLSSPNRGDEPLGGCWCNLDITALGRQEAWEDSPEGYPQGQTYKWLNWHDSYVV